MGEINASHLEKFLKSHGVLLEHETHDKIARYFSYKQITVLEHGVGYFSHQPSPKNTPLEIDVFFRYEAIKGGVAKNYTFEEDCLDYDQVCKRTGSYTDRETLIHDLIIECKGHASDGFLLARQKAAMPTSEEKSKQFVLRDDQAKLKYYTEYIHHALCDWAQFFNKSKSDGMKSFQEEKQQDKFHKFEEQMSTRILSQMQIVAGTSRRYAYCAIPVLVTNATILLINVIDGHVKIEEIPWFLYKNPYVSRYQSKFSQAIENMHVVGLNYLEGFLDRLGSEKVFEGVDFYKTSPDKDLVRKNKIPIEFDLLEG